MYIDARSEEVVSDSKKICLNYLQGRLLIDILASMPFEVVAGFFTENVDTVTSKFLSLLKMTRLLRLGRMISYFQIN